MLARLGGLGEDIGRMSLGRCVLCVVTLLVTVAGADGVWAGQNPGPGDGVAAVGNSRWTTGNSVRLLSGPRDSWEARLEIVDRARHHVHITTFSWHNDHYGKLYREKLVEVIRRKRRDNPEFQVRILVDSTARGVFDASFSKLKEAGAIVRSYNPGTWGIAPMYDLRMHDKMIVVDGRWAIVGGRNIADDYFNPRSWWLDFGVAVEGEAVHDLQMHFLKAWGTSDYLGKPHRVVLPLEVLQRRMRTFLTTGKFPGGRSPIRPYLNDAYFPRASGRADGLDVAILYDNPLIRSSAASTEVLIQMIAEADLEVDLMTPFPNFTNELTNVLKDATGRGVKVRLFINGKDSPLRRGLFFLAGLPTVIELIESGVEVWAWEGNGYLEDFVEESGCSPETMPPKALHGKLARIDHDWTIVHSSNFNIRSTYYNTEAGAVIRSGAFNQEVKELLDRLISLHDLRIECGEGISDLTIERMVRLLGLEDADEFRRILGGKQGFLDSMGVMW